MKNICVFCGSNLGSDTIYEQQAEELGALIAQHNIRLIYGGGNIGLMGAIADSVLVNGGEVTGVIPEFLMKREVGHSNLTELILTNSMHERKLKMAELADAFIAMPGGYGTLEELAEITTWVQLELMKKPIGVLNVNGFYNHLFDQINYMKSQNFIGKNSNEEILFENNPKDLLSKIIMKAEEMSGNETNLFNS